MLVLKNIDSLMSKIFESVLLDFFLFHSSCTQLPAFAVSHLIIIGVAGMGSNKKPETTKTELFRQKERRKKTAVYTS